MHTILSSLSEQTPFTEQQNELTMTLDVSNPAGKCILKSQSGLMRVKHKIVPKPRGKPGTPDSNRCITTIRHCSTPA